MYKLLLAKKASGKTFTQIAKEVGLTNLYTAQLFHNQVSMADAYSFATLPIAVPLQFFRIPSNLLTDISFHLSDGVEAGHGTSPAICCPRPHG